MEMSHRIEHELDRIEAEYGVTILYAVESGSRAWGFPSPDSDFDVRMVYHHPRDWYMDLQRRRDVSRHRVAVAATGGRHRRWTSRCAVRPRTIISRQPRSWWPAAAS